MKNSLSLSSIIIKLSVLIRIMLLCSSLLLVSSSSSSLTRTILNQQHSNQHITIATVQNINNNHKNISKNNSTNNNNNKAIKQQSQSQQQQQQQTIINICRPSLMDCSEMGRGQEPVLACLDCSNPTKKACGDPPQACSPFHTGICRGQCRPLRPGARKL